MISVEKRKKNEFDSNCCCCRSPTEESRVIEVKSERIVQESVTVTEVSTVITETHEVALTAAQGRF